MEVHRVVVLGDGGVGKTALTIQLCLNHFVETYDPTIEDSYRKQAIVDQKPCIIEVLDTAGQEEYSALRDQWIRDGDGFLLVYSITARSSFERVAKIREQIYTSKNRDKVAIVLVGNKSDQALEREVTTAEGLVMASSQYLDCKFVETSAKKYINVEEAFFEVVREIRSLKQKKQSPEGGYRGNVNERGSSYKNKNKSDIAQNRDPQGLDRGPSSKTTPHQAKKSRNRKLKCVIL